MSAASSGCSVMLLFTVTGLLIATSFAVSVADVAETAPSMVSVPPEVTSSTPPTDEAPSVSALVSTSVALPLPDVVNVTVP